MKLYQIGSIAFIALGLLHIMAHIMGNINPDDALLALQNQMANHKIQLFGQHSFLEFHTVFSLMMGFLLSAFGIQNLTATKIINKNYLTTTIILTGISLVISLIWFHLLASMFICFSLICYLLSLKNL